MARLQKTGATRRDPAQPDAGIASDGAPQESMDAEVTEPAAANVAQAQASNLGRGSVLSQPSARSSLLRRTCVRDRLMQTQDWPRVKEVLAQMRADPKLAPLSAEAREQFIWAELDRMYPESIATQAVATNAIEHQKQQVYTEQGVANLDSGKFTGNYSQSGPLKGLSDIPPDWPELPANASLTAEIGWVQSNRLYVVEELDRGGTRVRLDRAHEPAPSRAAIGWLETSIRSYAKYVEVAAKATGAGQDEQQQERAERMELESVRSLLAEMLT